jgi:hypothetical protein
VERADAREGRVRFQALRDPDYGYERFTAVPTGGRSPGAPEYPGAPDSTVVRFAAPAAAAARATRCRSRSRGTRGPSTVPRRQARAGRAFDFAHWYPKVAVYDRRGWSPRPLTPAGEFYGEFGSFDVTLSLRRTRWWAPPACR